MMRSNGRRKDIDLRSGVGVILIFIAFQLFSSCENSSSSSASTLAPKSYTPSSATTEETSTDESSKEATDDNSQDPKNRMNEDEYLEYLSSTIPYIGMSEEYIDKTACGEHTDTGDFSGHLGYRWSFNDLHALVVEVDEGKVIKVNPIHEDYFWDGDMPHLEDVDGKKVWKPIPGALHKRWEEHEARRDKTVDNFATAEEYADYYHDDFIDVMLAEEYYEDDIDDLVLLEESYLEAIDYWHKHQPWPEPEE